MGRRGRGRHARRHLPVQSRRPPERQNGRRPSGRSARRRMGAAGILRKSPHLAGRPVRGAGSGARRRGYPATIPARRAHRGQSRGIARRIGRCGSDRRRGVRHLANHGRRRYGRNGSGKPVPDATGGIRPPTARRRTPSRLRGVDARPLRGAARIQRMQRAATPAWRRERKAPRRRISGWRRAIR